VRLYVPVREQDVTRDRVTKPSQPTLSATELAVRAAESILRTRDSSAEVVAKGLASVSHTRTDSGGGSAAFSAGMGSARPDSGGGNAFVSISTTKHLGEVIRSARQKRGLSQQLLADSAGVGRRFLSELENGKTTLEFEKILQVANAVGVDLLAKLR